METFEDDTSIMLRTVTSGYLDPEYFEEGNNVPEKVINLGDEFLPRSGHSATVIGNIIYIFGGIDSNKNVYDNLLAYDIENKEIKSMKVKGMIPKARSSHAACTDILQTKVYIHGGADLSGVVYDDLISYNPIKNRFDRIEVTGDVPPPLYGHSLIPYKHYLYLFGGTSGYEYFNELYKLDLMTKTWTKLKPSGRAPEQRYKHCVVCNYPLDPSKIPMLSNNDPDAFFVIGGTNNKTLFGNIYRYLINKNQWESIKVKSNQDLFKSRYGHTSIYFNESIYVFGGWADKKRRNDLLRFDLHRNSWKKEEVGEEDYMPCERDFHASILHDNSFYVIGGSDKKEKLNEIHRIKIKDETPSRSIHKDFRNLLKYLSESHLFSDLRINFIDKEGKIKFTIYTYYPLVKKRAESLLNDLHQTEENGVKIYISTIEQYDELINNYIKYIFEYIYTDWIDFTDFDASICFNLLKFCISYRFLRLFKIISRYILINMSFANAIELLNNVSNVEQEIDIGELKSESKELVNYEVAFNTLKKVLLKYISTHIKKFKELKQYEELNSYSLLSLDWYQAMLKESSKKSSPKKNKENSIKINSDLLHIDRVTKDDSFMKQLQEIFQDTKNKNFTIKCENEQNEESYTRSQTFSFDMFVLAGRSEYFQNMFLSQMRESQLLEISVQLPRNIKPSTFKTFIKYLYCDDLALPDKMDIDESLYLFECSDFYQIPNSQRLKTLCETRVKGEKKENAEEIMIHAGLIGAKKIKKAASNIIKNQ